MISKELLGEVINSYDLIAVNTLNQVIYVDDNGSYQNINIHELANKCKKWAIVKGYQVSSSKPIVADDEGKQVFNYWWSAYLFKFDGGYESPLLVTKSFNAETEPEAIFKACQWILENK